jgi:hypothetical protein
MNTKLNEIIFVESSQKTFHKFKREEVLEVINHSIGNVFRNHVKG